MGTGGTKSVVTDDPGRVKNLCHPCGRGQKTTAATNLCATCQERLWAECCEPHRVFKPGEHDIMVLSGQHKIQILVDMNGMDKCTEHGHTFRYHCKDYDTLCCELCHIEMHKKCEDILEIKELVTEVENDDVKQILESISMQANDLVEHSDAKVHAIQTKVGSVRKEIENKKHLIEQLEERASAIKNAQTDNYDAKQQCSRKRYRVTEIARTIFSRGQITQWLII